MSGPVAVAYYFLLGILLTVLAIGACCLNSAKEEPDTLSPEVIRQRQHALNSLAEAGLIVRAWNNDQEGYCEIGPRFAELEPTRQHSVLLTVFVYLFDAADGRLPGAVLHVNRVGVEIATFDPEQGITYRAPGPRP